MRLNSTVKSQGLALREPGRARGFKRSDLALVRHRDSDIVEAVEKTVLRRRVHLELGGEPVTRHFDLQALDIDRDLDAGVGLDDLPQLLNY